MINQKRIQVDNFLRVKPAGFLAISPAGKIKKAYSATRKALAKGLAKVAPS